MIFQKGTINYLPILFFNDCTLLIAACIFLCLIVAHIHKEAESFQILQVFPPGTVPLINEALVMYKKALNSLLKAAPIILLIQTIPLQ